MGAALEALRRQRLQKGTSSPPPPSRPAAWTLSEAAKTGARPLFGGSSEDREAWLVDVEGDLRRLGWSPLWSEPLGVFVLIVRKLDAVPAGAREKGWKLVTVEELENGNNVRNVPVSPVSLEAAS